MHYRYLSCLFLISFCFAIEATEYVLSAESSNQEIMQLNGLLLVEPENPLYLLTLAQLYQGVKQYEQAIDCYERRIRLGGDREEIWGSTFMMGVCLDELGWWPSALQCYLDAFEMLPRCFDPLHKVVRHYRLQGQNDVAYLFAQSGLRFDRSYQSNLWNYPPLEDYQLDEEISIVAYYTRFQKEGLAAANRFMLRKGVPHWSRDQNRINLFWYPILLQGASFQPIHSSSHRFINGSIVKTETGYDLLCTAVNYFPIDQYIVHTDDPDGVLRSQLYLLSLDHHDQVMGEYLIQETLPREKIPSCNREGLEEGRFVIGYGNPNERWLTAVASDTHPEGSLQVCLAKLSSDNRSIETLLPLFGQKPERHEKNWLPFMDKDTLRFIYAYDPFVVATPDLTTGICRFDALYDYPWDLSLWKGAAAPIAFDDGYLMLVYETVMQPDCSLSYLHRFVFLDSTFRIKRISYPFIFLHKGMERSLGMSIDHSQTELIIPVGIGYKDLYLCRLPLEQVRSFLEQGTPD